MIEKKICGGIYEKKNFKGNLHWKLNLLKKVFEMRKIFKISNEKFDRKFSEKFSKISTDVCYAKTS